MSKTSKKTVTIVIIVVCVMAITAINLLKYPRHPDPAKSAAARTKGNPKSSVHIVEYLDFQCSYCAQGAKRLRELFQKYPDQILLEVKYYPLNGHVHGLTSARYAECAAQQRKFWDYEEKLFERQDQWRVLIDANPAFTMIARDIQMDIPRLESCLKDAKTLEIINKSKSEGDAVGVKSTPTFFVNGKIAVGTKLLDDELAPFFPKEKK